MITIWTSGAGGIDAPRTAARAVAGVLAAACGLLLPAAARAGQPAATWADDVAPLLRTRCAACHRPGGLAPFSLTSYDDAQARAAAIAEMTAARRMPPWLPVPVPGAPALADDPRLTDAEIDRLRAWADAGAPRGDPDPAGRETGIAGAGAGAGDDAWPLGPPDLVVSTGAVALPAGGGVIDRTIALPMDLAARRWVRAVDLRPDAAAQTVVQRAEVRLAPRSAAGSPDPAADAADAADAAPGTIAPPDLAPAPGRFPQGHVLAWAAGRPAAPAAADGAWPLDVGVDLRLRLVLRPRGGAVTLETSVGLYFADGPPARTTVGLLLDAQTLDIPAGAAAHGVSDRYRLPVAVDLTGVLARMGPLGRQVTATATTPDGAVIDLLRIDDWNPDWQDLYRYAEPVRLPAGAMVEAAFTFDNSDDNPRQRARPPAPVRYGPGPADERADLLLLAAPAAEDDTAALLDHLALKRARNDILGLQARLRADPDDAQSHGDLAVRYLDVQQPALAREHLDRALALAPDDADVHFALGSLRMAEGDVQGAMAAFREAIALRPEYAEAHNNLGALLVSTGALNDAMVYYRLALQFDPRNASAQYNLGNVLFALGQRDDAVPHFREAATLTPEDADVHYHLARALSAAGAHGEAITHYERALDLDAQLPLALLGLSWLRATAPDDALRRPAQALALAQQAVAIVGADHPELLDTLAAAYAANGRFDDALATARTAVDAARARAGFEVLVPGIEGRIRLYLTFRPYRMPAPEP